MPGLCARCKREVYFAEEKVAVGKVWHSFCFSCRSCRKLLDSCSVAPHSGELFCRNCYSRLFPPTWQSARMPVNQSWSKIKIPTHPPRRTRTSVSDSDSFSDNYYRCSDCASDNKVEDTPQEEENSHLEKFRLRGGGGTHEISLDSDAETKKYVKSEYTDSNSTIPAHSRNSTSSPTAVTTWYNRQHSASLRQVCPYNSALGGSSEEQRPGDAIMQHDPASSSLRKDEFAEGKHGKEINQLNDPIGDNHPDPKPHPILESINPIKNIPPSNQDVSSRSLTIKELHTVNRITNFDRPMVERLRNVRMKETNEMDRPNDGNHLWNKKSEHLREENGERMRGGCGGCGKNCGVQGGGSCCDSSQDNCSSRSRRTCCRESGQGKCRTVCPSGIEYDECSPPACSVPACCSNPPPCSDRRGCCSPPGVRPICQKPAMNCSPPCKNKPQGCGGGGCCGAGCRGGCGKPGQTCLPIGSCSSPPCRVYTTDCPAISPCSPPRSCAPSPPCCGSPRTARSPMRTTGTACCRSQTPRKFTSRFTGGRCCDSTDVDDCCRPKVQAGCECFGGGVDCQRCGRKVYHAEMQIASGVPYHNICFSCFCCRKPLEPLSYEENCGEIYCKQCYVRNFGPQGYGYGVGAGVLQTPL